MCAYVWNDWQTCLHAEDAGHEDDDSQQHHAAVRRHAANAARFAHHAVRGVIAGHWPVE